MKTKIKNLDNFIIDDALVEKGQKLFKNRKVTALNNEISFQKGERVASYSFLVGNYSNSRKDVCKFVFGLDEKSNINCVKNYLCTCSGFLRTHKCCEHLAACLCYIDKDYFSKSETSIKESDSIDKVLDKIINSTYYYSNEENILALLKENGIDTNHLSVDDFLKIVTKFKNVSYYSKYVIEYFIKDLFKINNYSEEDISLIVDKLFYDEKNKIIISYLYVTYEDDIKKKMFNVMVNKLNNIDNPLHTLIQLNFEIKQCFQFFPYLKEEKKYSFLSIDGYIFSNIDLKEKYYLYNFLNEIASSLDEKEKDEKVKRINNFYSLLFAILEGNNDNVNYKIKEEDIIFFDFLIKHKEIFQNQNNHIVYFLLNADSVITFIKLNKIFTNGIDLLKANKEALLRLINEDYLGNTYQLYYGLLDIEKNRYYMTPEDNAYYNMGSILAKMNFKLLDTIFEVVKNSLNKKYCHDYELDIVYLLLDLKYEKLINKINKAKDKLNNKVYDIYLEYLFNNNEYSELEINEIKVD